METLQSMKIGLVDIDSKIPNLALMKLSAWFKTQGTPAQMVEPLWARGYDQVYASQIFTWSNTPGLAESAFIGGPGINRTPSLPQQVNDTCPDYNLYGIDYSMGYLTRGCPRKCSWCIVPQLEGDIRPEHDIEVFLRHNKAILMDNNVLASPFGIKQIEKISRMDVRIDFNQGLDARLIDKPMARLLARCKWIRFIRVACDFMEMLPIVINAVDLLRGAGYKGEIFCYVLVQEIETALERVNGLRAAGIDPFAQPYRDRNGNTPSDELKHFARWVNHKAIFKTVKWKEYKNGMS